MSNHKKIPTQLAIVLAGLGEKFSQRRDPINLNTPLRRASNLIYNLLRELPESDKFETAKEVLNNSTNVVMTAEIGLSLNGRSSKESIFNDKEQHELQKLVAELIEKDENQNGPFYLRENVKRNSPLLYNLWTQGTNIGEVEKFITDSFEGKSSNAIEFLKAFTPTRGTMDGEIYYGIFEADQYEKVKRLVSPKVIYDILSKNYSIHKKSFSKNDYVEMDQLFLEEKVEEGLIQKFTYYYFKDDDFNGRSSLLLDS